MQCRQALPSSNLPRWTSKLKRRAKAWKSWAKKRAFLRVVRLSNDCSDPDYRFAEEFSCSCRALPLAGRISDAEPVVVALVDVALVESSHPDLAFRCATAKIRRSTVEEYTMEILDLLPREFGVTEHGVYVLDDDGRVIAGPFYTEADALTWIEETVPRRKSSLPH
jgi:hypothetical protein